MKTLLMSTLMLALWAALLATVGCASTGSIRSQVLIGSINQGNVVQFPRPQIEASQSGSSGTNPLFKSN